jgi:hypothetical protein
VAYCSVDIWRVRFEFVMALHYVIEAQVCFIVEFMRSIERQSFISDFSAAW